MREKLSPSNFPHTVFLYERILDNVHPPRFAISLEVPGGPSRYANRIEIGRKSGKRGR